MKRALISLVPATALAVCLLAVDLPLFAVGPGPAHDVVPLIEVDGATTYASEGHLLLTTVSIVPATVVEAIRGWLDPATAVVAERDVLPRGQTDREYEQALAQLMDESQVAAIAVALERLTDYPEDHREGAMVQRVFAGTPAEGNLVPGDVIAGVDGRRVRDVEQVSRAIRQAGAGRMLTMSVRSGNERREVSLEPVRLPDQDRPVIGVVLVENFPFDVRIDSGGVGGPSAGLMWALGLIELLTPADLSGGRTVAGTGSIDLEGNVLPIGGVQDKILTAERNGAEVFLLPWDNRREAGRVDTRIELIPVRTVGQAVEELEARG